MAVSVTSQTNPFVDKLIVDTDANATVEANILSGGATCYIFDGSNANNTADSYIKVWNATGPTNNSTEFDLLFLLPAGTRQTVTIIGGVYLSTGLSFNCTTTADLAGVTAPTNAVTVRIMAE
jgi:hypothetical protein